MHRRRPLSVVRRRWCMAHVRVAVVKRVAQVFRSFEEADEADDRFYASLAPEKRLDVLLELIERYRGELGEAATRFERVHHVTELSRS